MNTKEAIEFIEYLITIADERYNEDSVKKKDEVIDLLKRGEKFEKMWGELEKEKCIMIDFNNEGYYKGDHKLSDIKQKYFPKGGS